ncbi:MAG: right-handed parallel beta-helix repeat-containing protein [Methanosarcina sp.]
MSWEGYGLLSGLPCKKVLFQAGLKGIFALTLFFVCCVGVAGALELTVNPTGANNDQTVINQALEDVKNAGGGKVYLTTGVYKVDNTVIIWSNTVLYGSPDAVIMVAPTSSRWFTGSTGIISCKESVKKVEIYGFQIDGNLGAFPPEYANSHSPHKKDCMRCIILHGESGNYADNIKIHDMKLFDSFSDGSYIYYATNVRFYNNFVSNTQHEGVFFSVVINGEISNNKIAGVTSDCARLDNSINCRIFDNIFFSYDGTNLNGAYPHGENGLQIGNAGSSHGYNAANKPTVTANIEVFNNTFANNGLKAILLGSGSDNNVFVHNNKFINVAELEQLGISVKGLVPTKETSERIFNSIFDILNKIFTFQYPDKETVINASAEVIEYNNTFNPHSLVYVTGEGLTGVKYEYGNQSTTHYFSINEGSSSSGADIWEGELQHTGNAVYLEGALDESKLKITGFNPDGYNTISKINITEEKDNSNQILNPMFWAFLGTLTILGISIYRNARRVIKW